MKHQHVRGAVCAAVISFLSGCGDLADRGSDDVALDDVESVVAQGVTATGTLAATADTTLRGGNKNTNYGAATVLEVQATSSTRKGIVKFNPTSLLALTAGKSVVSAHLELHVDSAASGFPASGQNLRAHALTVPWTETQATWNCAIDTSPTNNAANCAGATAWSIGAPPFPYRPEGAAVLIQNGRTGIVRFDVTADVRLIAGGTADHGWLIKRENETVGGNITFRSRNQATNPPRLVIVTAGPCGDGVTDPDNAEQCDDGNLVTGDGCTSACVDEFCGDGVDNDGTAEECDDGNGIAGDGCTTCVVDVCGDGVVNNSGTEGCDDGNGTNFDGCTACISDTCGDGVVNNSGIEACDDGNTVSGDGCSLACVDEVCGDGAVNDSGSEACDDGNVTEGDGCSPRCIVEVCGDGTMNNHPFEQCDDGNTVSGDGCDASCTAERCGDDTDNDGTGEACDDGDRDSLDGCSRHCLLEVCGDGVKQAGEGCDDGNTVSGDGCSATCVSDACGDGIVNNGEACDWNADTYNCNRDCTLRAYANGRADISPWECDDGNRVSGDGCSEWGMSEWCGDGTINNGEQCDWNADTYNCNRDCTLRAYANGRADISPWECDDGNRLSGDGCSEWGMSEWCGDGTINNGEQCDWNANPSICNRDCTLRAHGNGRADLSPWECDDGNRIDGDGCSAFGIPEVEPAGPLCGNGLIDDGEDCDGNAGCAFNCGFEVCGNGIIGDGEQCDDGDELSGNGCSATCQYEFCGDGVINNGEECDGTPGCIMPRCVVSRCGDGFVDQESGEQCDDGDDTSGNGCSAACQHEYCGDAVINNGEECDLGTSGCILPRCVLSRCGDGFVDQDSGEQCDDGDDVSGNGCSATCHHEYCGDGVINNGEACDRGTAGCIMPRCVLSMCGDGFLDSNVGEECDDGDDLSGNGCSATCRHEYCGDGVVNNGEECDLGTPGCFTSRCVLSRCGDGIVASQFGEQCDDGDAASGDGCSSACAIEICGDGLTNGDEDCDDGNAIDDDGCTFCVADRCGDGYRQASEACDDGNVGPGDGCSATCQLEVCGDGKVDVDEACDDGNDIAGDGCDPFCAFE